MSEISRSSRRGRRAMSDINVVPYIDVMLVLLIIFMVTAPMVNPGVVDLPSVGKTDVKPRQAPIKITIKTDESISVTNLAKTDSTEKNVSKTEMLAYIKSIQADKPDTPVVIAASKDVRYDIVMQVMDELAKNNIKVGLFTKPRS